jgi:hypothetical protein
MARQAARANAPALNDFRLFWDAVSQALAGRDKVIVDAEKLPGRRQLLLFDPESPRGVLPGVLPPTRIPAPITTPRTPRTESHGEGP